jgi:hypothetical protein
LDPKRLRRNADKCHKDINLIRRKDRLPKARFLDALGGKAVAAAFR